MGTFVRSIRPIRAMVAIIQEQYLGVIWALNHFPVESEHSKEYSLLNEKRNSF